MSKRLPFLQLTAEFGGTKFGPFTNPEIRLGSDPEKNDIVLPEGLGVAPEHVRLTKQQDDAYVLAPTARTTTVYLYKVDGRPPKQITSPTTITEGDGFSVVTPEGPRFTLVLEAERKEKAADEGKAKKKKGKDKLSAGTMMEEIKRQGLARALATGAGQFLGNAWTFIKSGSFMQPRYIIMGLMLLSGWVFAGGIGCTAAGVGYQLQSTNEELGKCQADLQGFAGTPGEDSQEEFSLAKSTVQLLGSPLYKKVLQDEVLRTKLLDRLKALSEDGVRDDYRWVWTRKKSPYVEFRKRLTASKKISDPQKRLFAYAAVDRGENQENEWSLVRDSRGENACGRGPLSITQRMGRNLKLTNLQLDVWVDTDTKDQLGGTTGVDLFFEKWKAQNPGVKDITREGLGEVEVKVSDAQVGEGWCAYIDGDDDRTKVSELVPALEKAIGAGADGMPEEGDDYYLPNRTLKFFTTDFAEGQSVLSSFKSKKPTAIVTRDEVQADAKEWALDRVADTMAKAMLIPCFSRLEKDAQNKPPELKNDEPSSVTTCGLLLIAIEYGEAK